MLCGLLSDEVINIEDVRQEEVPADHERDLQKATTARRDL
jgi:hypothetical protein